MRFLITGFEPFNGQKINPSWQAVQGMADMPGVELIRRELPVTYFTSREILNRLIDEFEPDCVLCTGQAGGRAKVSIERVAINLCEASIPDEAGVQLKDTPIVPGGERAYFATYPHEAILRALEAAEIPAAYSFSAGAYICNHVMYTALEAAQRRHPEMIAGFIHLPFLPEQTEDQPALPLAVQTRALETIVKAIRGTRAVE